MKQLLHIALLMLISLTASQATAANMTLAEVIDTVISVDPGLKLSRMDTAITATDHQRIEGLLDPVVTGSLSVSHEQIPVASDFQAVMTRSATAAGSIAKPLTNGGTLSVDFNYNRTGQDFISPLAAQLAKFNPAYRNQINLSYRHPLLRGADNPDYNQAIVANKSSTQASKFAQQIVARSLALQAINNYYQLASDGINIHIAEQAVTRAKRLLGYQYKREQFGLIERADRLQAEALLAARKTDLQQAIARRAADLSLLNRLMLRKPDTPLTIVIDSSPLPEPVAFNSLLATALQQRPELKALQAQLDAADAQLRIANDGDQSQLDLIAQLGTRALNGNPGVAASQGLSIHDHFASLSVEYSDQLGRNSTRAAIRKSELARQRITADQLRSTEQISDQLAAASTALSSGIPFLQATRQQAVAEARKFAAEMKRYREGRSDTATIVQFEGDLRNAQLRSELQLLSLQLATTQLAWASGDLPATKNMAGI
ncbi:MAG: TolC family protein [Mariprofundus sp.]